MIIIVLGGQVALLLWGTHMVQTGVQRAFGPALRLFLARALSNRVRGFAAGMAVTTVVQSSTATGLIVAGLAADGVVDLLPALAVMLGSNVGTTLIVQALSFDISPVAPALILCGVTLFRKYRATRLHDIGRMLIGVGLMFLALHGLLQAVTPYEEAPTLRTLIELLSAAPLLAMLCAAALTWLVHSSVAIILVLISLASKGVISSDTAFAIVIGANLGAAINPVIEGVTGPGLAAKRLPVGNFLARAIGASFVMCGLEPVAHVVMRITPNLGHAIADFHTAFNVILALVLLPILDVYARILVKLLPVKLDLNDPSLPIYLSSAALDAPNIALSDAAREALRLTDIIETMLVRAEESIANWSRQIGSEQKALAQSQRALSQSIQGYLTRLDLDELSESEHHRLNAIFAFVSNLCSATNILEKGLQRLVTQRWNHGQLLDPSDHLYLTSVMDRVRNNVRAAATLLMSSDHTAAKALADEKRFFRKLEIQANRLHFERLRAGSNDSSFRLDLVRELKGINAFLVAAAVYPIFDRIGSEYDVNAIGPIESNPEGFMRRDE